MSSYVPPHLRGKTTTTATATAAAAAASLSKGTMASFTTSRPASRQAVQVPTDSVEEFPTLRVEKRGDQKEKKTAWSQSAGRNFAELARSWAVQQKEEEEERKRQAKERLTAEQQEREREKKERAYFRVVDPTKILYGSSHARKEAVYDLGGDQEEMVEEVYEEDPEPEQVIEDVSYRRSKHDLY